MTEKKSRFIHGLGGDRPSDVANAAVQKKEEGFRAIKMNATEELQYVENYEKLDAVLERVASIREAIARISAYCFSISPV